MVKKPVSSISERFKGVPKLPSAVMPPALQGRYPAVNVNWTGFFSLLGTILIPNFCAIIPIDFGRTCKRQKPYLPIHQIIRYGKHTLPSIFQAFHLIRDGFV